MTGRPCGTIWWELKLHGHNKLWPYNIHNKHLFNRNNLSWKTPNAEMRFNNSI